MRRSFRGRTGRLGIALAALAVGAFALPGSQTIALCITPDGHLDLKHVSEGCHGCPVAQCARDADQPAPADPADPAGTALPLPETCCRDIPVAFDLVGGVMPRVLVDGDASGEPSRTPATAVASVGLTTATQPGGPAGDPVPSRPPTCQTTTLSCVILLL